MDERIEKIKNYLNNNPEDLFLNHALALEYIKLGKDQEAEIHFRKNLNTDSQYIATYYHLGKLLERGQQKQEALDMYQQGMQMAKLAKDQHSYNELQGAYEDLEDE